MNTNDRFSRPFWDASTDELNQLERDYRDQIKTSWSPLAVQLATEDLELILAERAAREEGDKR